MFNFIKNPVGEASWGALKIVRDGDCFDTKDGDTTHALSEKEAIELFATIMLNQNPPDCGKFAEVRRKVQLLERIDPMFTITPWQTAAQAGWCRMVVIEKKDSLGSVDFLAAKRDQILISFEGNGWRNADGRDIDEKAAQEKLKRLVKCKDDFDLPTEKLYLPPPLSRNEYHR